MFTISEKIIDSVHDNLVTEYLGKNDAGFRDFLAKKSAAEGVAGQFRMKSAQVADLEQEKALLEENMTFYQRPQIAKSILQSTRNAPAGITGIEHAATQHAGIFMLREFGSEILKINATELRAATAELEAFKSENIAVLRELGLVKRFSKS